VTRAALTLTTPRLLLRAWREEDLAAFAALNADARVMEFFPKPLTRAESDTAARRNAEHFERHGFGKWAVEVRSGPPFVGYVGLAVPAFEAHFTPCVEIGWRLAAEHWGRGYATEGARASLAHAFDVLDRDEVVSFTTTANQRSRHVMEKLGLVRRPEEDFDHPGVPATWTGRRHVVYAITREQWRRAIAL